MRDLKNSSKGFSLIEVVVSLLLLGIVSAIWGLGIVQVTEGFLLSVQNRETSQNVQTCMSRLTKEFQSITSLPPASVPSSDVLAFIRNTGGADETHTVSFVSGTGEIQIDSHVLTDRVNSFTLRYYDTHDAVIPLPSPVTPEKVRLIGIRLEVRGADDILSVYENRVFLRGLKK